MATGLQIFVPELEVGIGEWVDILTASTFVTTGFGGVTLQGKSWILGGYTAEIRLGSQSSCFFAADEPPAASPVPTPADPPLPPVWPYPVGNVYQRENWSMKIQMIRLDTKSVDFQAYEGDGTVFDLTGCTVRFTVKWDYFDADAAAVIKLDNAGLGGISIPTPTSGTGRLTIPKTATSSLPIHRSDLVYDIKVKKADATEHTVARGPFIVFPNATETI